MSILQNEKRVTDQEKSRVLLLSRHDYRTEWRANFHPIADAFRDLGFDVSFFSTGFSFLSYLAKDRRRHLDARSNKWERVDGVNCYLWRSILHPVRFNNTLLDRVADPLFAAWAASNCKDLDQVARSAALILVESDLSATLIRRLRRTSPKAKIIYVASDLLCTINAAPAIARSLIRERTAIDHVVAVSRAMIPDLRVLERPVTFIPHGLQPDDFTGSEPSPYSRTSNFVCVGSMLFDADAIISAAESLPESLFHLIGTPPGEAYPSNVVEHGMMPFRETIRWIRHADVGIAPYKMSDGAKYLADSSMKLAQYNYLGIPAVCPHFAVGDHPLRFGYEPGNSQSIVNSFQAAMSAPHQSTVGTRTWREIATQMSML